MCFTECEYQVSTCALPPFSSFFSILSWWQKERTLQPPTFPSSWPQEAMAAMVLSADHRAAVATTLGVPGTLRAILEVRVAAWVLAAGFRRCKLSNGSMICSIHLSYHPDLSEILSLLVSRPNPEHISTLVFHGGTVLSASKAAATDAQQVSPS